jgi:hypothetical protein
LISKKFEKKIVFESSVLAWIRIRNRIRNRIRIRIRIEKKCWIRIRIRIEKKCWIRIRIRIRKKSIRIHNPALQSDIFDINKSRLMKSKPEHVLLNNRTLEQRFAKEKSKLLEEEHSA